VKVSRVRPGALVVDDAGALQVVVGLRESPQKVGCRYAAFANGQEEWWPSNADVETVRLTEAQASLLRAANESDGLVVEVGGDGTPDGLVHTVKWPLIGWERRVLVRVHDLGLVSLGSRVYGRTVKFKKAKPTELGRAWLDINSGCLPATSPARPASPRGGPS
jgi:hypothetical protein